MRKGAQRLLLQVVEAELEAFLEEHKRLRDPRGRRAIVRNGYLPAREIMTGLGPIEVGVPKSRGRNRSGTCLRSSLLPPYIRKTKSMENLMPWLYLKGISTGDFAASHKTITPTPGGGFWIHDY